MSTPTDNVTTQRSKTAAAVVPTTAAAVFIKSITLGCFNPETKAYFDKTIPGYMELTSLVGNISRKDNLPYIHLHANASDEDLNVIGGHLVEAIISATCEICVAEANGKINRKFSDEIGLNIFDFN